LDIFVISSLKTGVGEIAQIGLSNRVLTSLVGVCD
jgi:hypothetical protein